MTNKKGFKSDRSSNLENTEKRRKSRSLKRHIEKHDNEKYIGLNCLIETAFRLQANTSNIRIDNEYLFNNVKMGNMAVVKLLLEKGANIDTKEYNGITALMFAVNNGHAKTINQLLNKGANFNEKSNNGGNALMIAAQFRHTETVQLLIDKGADISRKDNNRMTALKYASENGHTEIVELLNDKRDLNPVSSSNFSSIFSKSNVTAIPDDNDSSGAPTPNNL